VLRALAGATGGLALMIPLSRSTSAAGAAPAWRAAPRRSALDDEPPLEASNLRLLSHHDLNGAGNMGEGIAIQQLATGRRIGYFANESGPIGMSVVDVTNPRDPGVLAQIPAENDHTRFNSLSMSGDILVVARQTAEPGQDVAGMVVYDASDPENLQQLAFFDTSGPFSRGCHFVWFVDGRYAFLSTGMPDFQPADAKDDQFLVIVDLADPTDPREVGRWWLPGMQMGEPPLDRLPMDSGYRLHNVNVLPSQPDRAYCGWIDGGLVILDISDLASPQLVARWDPYPPQPGYAHTAVPHLERGLLTLSEEAVTDGCQDAPKNIWVINLADESNPVPLSTVPQPDPAGFCGRGGRFGAHNQHENHEQPTARELHNVVIGSFFNAGVRLYDIRNPYRPEEIAAYVPARPARSRVPAVQINDVYVDEHGVIYALERFGGGIYLLEYTGSVPLA
jgi:hypothetical protein